MATKSLCYFKNTRQIVAIMPTTHVWGDCETGVMETPLKGYMAVVDLTVTTQNETDLGGSTIYVNDATTPTSIVGS